MQIIHNMNLILKCGFQCGPQCDLKYGSREYRLEEAGVHGQYHRP